MFGILSSSFCSLTDQVMFHKMFKSIANLLLSEENVSYDHRILQLLAFTLNPSNAGEGK